MQAPDGTQDGTASAAVRTTGSSLSGRLFALSRTLYLAGGIGVVAAVLAFGLWLLLGGLRPWPSDPLQPPAFPSLDWWLTPIERNAFARVPVISGGLADIVEQPGRGRLWAVGESGLIVRSDDGGLSWRQVTDIDWSALTSPPQQPPVPQQQEQQQQPLQQQQVPSQQQQQQQQQLPSTPPPRQQQIPVPQYQEAPIQREAPAKKSDAGPLDLLLRGASAQEAGGAPAAPVTPAEPVALTTGQAFDLRAMAFSADGERAVIVGARGAVLISEDAGDTWRARHAGVDAALRAVDLAVDGQRAVAVGERGTLLISRDGGDAWMRIDAGTRATLHGVDLDAAGQSAVAVGETSTVLVSRDGGASWQPRPSRRSQDLYAVRVFADARRAVAVGESGTVLVSDDGGSAWDRLDTGSGADLWSVDGSADGERVIASGAGGTLVLIDGAARSARTVASGTQAGLAAVYASADGERLFAAGADGTVLASRDGGRRWHRLSAGAGADLHAVAIAAQRGRAVAVGKDGRVLVSDDTGDRWRPVVLPSNASLRAVAISADAQRVIAVGESPRPLLSEDGGAHWREVEVDTQEMLRGVALSADGRRAVAVGLDGVVLVSDDGGASWRRSDAGVTAGLVAAALSRDGQVAVAAGDGAMILSRDGGASWQPLESSPDARMSVSSLQISEDGQQLVVAGADGAVLLFGDGGASLRAVASGASAIRHVTALDAARRLVGVGPAGSVVISPDGGRSWRSVDSGTGVDLAAVAFAPDGRRGIAVGHGRILLSDDIGQSWRPVAYARFPAPWTYVAAFVLGLVSFIVARAYSRAGPAAAPDAGIAALAASDRPIGRGDRDPLDFNSIARGLSRFLRNAGTEPPLTIGVTGEWGTGKSSLMRLLHDDLLMRDFRPVWFNAWHHQKGEQLLASLFEHIRGQGVPPLFSRMGVRYRARLLWQRGRDRWLRYGLLAALFAAALVYAVLHGAEVRELLRLVGDTAAQQGWLAAAEALLGNVGLKGAGTFAALLLPVLTALRALRAFGIDAGALMTGAGSGGERRESKLRPGARYVFAREFRDVTRALEPYTMVIFIDDLDRCHKDVVPEVLETVNFLMTSGTCFVVLGMARAWVETCVGLAFEELAKEMDDALEHGDGKQLRRDFARDYLEKLLNVEVPVPEAGEEQSRALLAPDLEHEELPQRARAAVVGTLREVAPALGLAAVAALGAWLGFALPSLELRPRAPPEIRAEVGTLTLRPPAALADGGAQLAIPIERRREPAGGGDTVVLGQVSFEGARGDVAIEFRSADGAPPAPSEQVARRLVLGSIDAGEHDADLVLRLHAGAESPGAAVATGRAGAGAPAGRAPEAGAPSRRAATVEAGQPPSPWPDRVLIMASVLLVILIVVVAYTPPGVVERDSPAFLEALRLWHPWIVARRNTPRAVKRYLNRVRYVAMRCKHDAERADAGEDELPEPIAVALTALDAVSVDQPWVRSDAGWHGLVQRDFETLLRTSFPDEPDAQHLRDLAARLRAIVEAHITHQKFQPADRDLFNDAFRARYVRVTGEIRSG